METSLTWVWEEIKTKERASRAVSDVSPEPEEVQADDSVSQVNLKDCRPKSKHGSVVSNGSRGSSLSSLSTVRIKEEAERAAVIARALALEQKQVIDLEEAKLKAKREKLEVDAALAESTAKLKVLESYEEDGMNSYISKRSCRVKLEDEKEDCLQSSARECFSELQTCDTPANNEHAETCKPKGQ